MLEPERQVLALAASQRGLVTLAQAFACGMTRGQVNARCRAGHWHRVDDGVYLIAGQPFTWEAQLLAHCLGHVGVVSHRSAAQLWGLPGGDAELVEITALRHRRRSWPGVVWHESRLLDERTDVVERFGIPVTSPARTILDLAGVVDENVVEGALDSAESRNFTSKSHLMMLLGRRNMMRRPGAKVIGGLLDRRLDEARRPMSYYETRLRQLLRDAGLPEPIAQYRLDDRLGKIGYADFAWVDVKVAFEMQSYAWHATRPSLIKDSRRFSRLSAIGWRPLPIVTSDLDDHPQFVVDLARDAREAPMPDPSH